MLISLTLAPHAVVLIRVLLCMHVYAPMYAYAVCSSVCSSRAYACIHAYMHACIHIHAYQVLVRVLLAGINGGADTFTVTRADAGAVDIPLGKEGVGVAVAVGDAAAAGGFSVGQRLTFIGAGYSEYSRVRSRLCYAVDEAIDPAEQVCMHVYAESRWFREPRPIQVRVHTHMCACMCMCMCMCICSSIRRGRWP